MDRATIQYGQLSLETDLLRAERFAMVGLAKLVEALWGSSTAVDGFATAPTTPASMSVNVGPGQVYQQASLEATPWSSLAADTSHIIMKQGLQLDTATQTFVAPTTVGYAQNFLIQVAYADSDTGLVVRPYYNAADPSVPFVGPGNAGTQDSTTRAGVAVLGVKAGIAATSGTQSTPTPDAGYAGLYVVTVAYGQTTITAGNIVAYPGAPFIRKVSELSAQALFQALPIYPEITTPSAGGAFAFTTSTGSVVLSAAQTWQHRGGISFTTDRFSTGERTFGTSASKTYHLVWDASGTGLATPASTYPLGRFSLIDRTSASPVETDPSYDTTYDRMLCAKVVTNGSNVPTVTPLVNKIILRAGTILTGTPFSAVGGSGSKQADYTFTTNFARTPIVQVSAYLGATVIVGGKVEGGANYMTVPIVTTRYATTFNVVTDWDSSLDSSGSTFVSSAQCSAQA